MGVELSISAGVCLNIWELIVFSANGQAISHALGGGLSPTLTSVWSDDEDDYGPANAVDMKMTDPWTASVSGLAHSACRTEGDAYRIAFSAPVGVSSIFLVNRRDAGCPDQPSSDCGTRLVAGQATMRLLLANGTAIFSQQVAATETVITFLPGRWPAAPFYPASGQAASGPVRYVRIVGAVGEFLHMREVWAFDATGRNVALLKRTSSSTTYTGDNTAYPASSVVNNVIQMDASLGDMWHGLSSSVYGDVWWLVRARARERVHARTGCTGCVCVRVCAYECRVHCHPWFSLPLSTSVQAGGSWR